jgi:flavin reductase (DIM6/NTAB) family NADH-FMN oxidoreductase RutF
MTRAVLSDAAVDTGLLRRVLGRFATGVAVVTTCTPAGIVGMTINSFCSVSLEPPLLLFCVAHRSQLRDALSSATAFAINVLGEGQQTLSEQFARPGLDRFGAARWRPGTTRSPVFVEAPAVLECVTERVIELGDHDLVVGRVVTVHPVAEERPLVFFAGKYHELHRDA